MMTTWVAPGKGSTLKELLDVAVRESHEKSQERISRLMDLYGGDVRTNLLVDPVSPARPYDMDRISIGCLQVRRV